MTYVSNYTDVDDKVIDRAAELGRDPLDLVNDQIALWEQQQRALNLQEPDVRPRVTEHIETIIEAIERIIEAGYGYATAAGDVYYRVRALDGYGKLSHRNIEELREGTRGEPGEGKEFPLDFALWKAMKPGEPNWPSPWGPGRPGWHIECSAMSERYLGASFDIHGGGVDLVFPHHENEVAQAEAVSGPGSFAQIWLHNGLVQRDGEKMSKSIGNVVTVREALETWRPDALRLFVLESHYRRPNNLTDEAMTAAERGLDRLLAAVRDEGAGAGPPRPPAPPSAPASSRRSRTTSTRRARSPRSSTSRARSTASATPGRTCARRRRSCASWPACSACASRPRTRLPTASTPSRSRSWPRSTRWPAAAATPRRRSRRCWRAASRRARSATSPSPTRSAPTSPPPASRWRTRPEARAGARRGRAA